MSLVIFVPLALLSLCSVEPKYDKKFKTSSIKPSRKLSAGKAMSKIIILSDLLADNSELILFCYSLVYDNVIFIYRFAEAISTFDKI